MRWYLSEVLFAERAAACEGRFAMREPLNLLGFAGQRND
jgi:hypothetical protein